jgi:hypothetical protein
MSYRKLPSMLTDKLRSNGRMLVSYSGSGHQVEPLFFGIVPAHFNSDNVGVGRIWRVPAEAIAVLRVFKLGALAAHVRKVDDPPLNYHVIRAQGAGRVCERVIPEEYGGAADSVVEDPNYMQLRLGDGKELGFPKPGADPLIYAPRLGGFVMQIPELSIAFAAHSSPPPLGVTNAPAALGEVAGLDRVTQLMPAD